MNHSFFFGTLHHNFRNFSVVMGFQKKDIPIQHTDEGVNPYFTFTLGPILTRRGLFLGNCGIFRGKKRSPVEITYLVSPSPPALVAFIAVPGSRRDRRTCMESNLNQQSGNSPIRNASVLGTEPATCEAAGKFPMRCKIMDLNLPRHFYNVSQRQQR